MVLNITFNTISVISWLSVLLVEETGVPGENHRLVASHWQTSGMLEVHCTYRYIYSNYFYFLFFSLVIWRRYFWILFVGLARFLYQPICTGIRWTENSLSRSTCFHRGGHVPVDIWYHWYIRSCSTK